MQKIDTGVQSGDLAIESERVKSAKLFDIGVPMESMIALTFQIQFVNVAVCRHEPQLIYLVPFAGREAFVAGRNRYFGDGLLQKIHDVLTVRISRNRRVQVRSVNSIDKSVELIISKRFNDLIPSRVPKP